MTRANRMGARVFLFLCAATLASLGWIGDGAAQSIGDGAAQSGLPGQSPAAQPAEEPLGIVSIRELQVHANVGGEYYVFGYGGNRLVGAGPAIRAGAQWIRWWGGFLLGGGPSLYYSFLLEGDEPRDTIQQLTVNGDMIIGGGIYGKFAVYAHFAFGAGVAMAYDGDTDQSFTLPWVRARVGVGGWYRLTSLISLGLVCDIGWPGTLETLLSVGFHFGGPEEPS